MRVLLLTDSDVFAGTERHMLDLAGALSGRGCAVTLSCPDHAPLSGQAREAGIAVVPIASRGAVDWRAALVLRGALRRGEFDVVHAHNGRTTLTGAIAVALAGRGRLVATQHFIQPSRLGRRGFKRIGSNMLHRWVGRRVDRFIAISQATRDGMVQRGDCPERKIVIVPNGITALPQLSPSDQESVRAGLGVAQGVGLIVCVARLEPEKDVSILIDAMARLPAAPKAVCVIIGDGSQKTDIDNRIANLGLRSSVRLAGFRSDAAALIGSADMLVLPSRAEPFGLVILEAMALGKPVIATAAGGPLEIVEDGVTGLLTRPGDPDALAAAIADLLTDPARRRAMGSAGHARFNARFTAGHMAAATAAVYAEVLKCPEAPIADDGLCGLRSADCGGGVADVRC